MNENTTKNLSNLIKDPRFLSLMGMSVIFLVIGIVGVIVLLLPIGNNKGQSEIGELLNQEETEEVISKVFKENNLDLLPDQTPSNNNPNVISNRNDSNQTANPSEDQIPSNIASSGNIGFSPASQEENEKKIKDIDSKINDPEIKINQEGLLRTSSITLNYGAKSDECNIGGWKIDHEIISKEFVSANAYLSSYNTNTSEGELMSSFSYQYDKEEQVNYGFDYAGGDYGVKTIFEYYDNRDQLYTTDSYPISYADVEDLDSYPGIDRLSNFKYYKIETDSGRVDYLQVYERKYNACKGDKGLNNYISKTYINGETFEIYMREDYFDGETEDNLYSREEISTERQEISKDDAISTIYFKEVYPDVTVVENDVFENAYEYYNLYDYDDLIDYVNNSNYDLLEFEVNNEQGQNPTISYSNISITTPKDNYNYHFDRKFYPNSEYGEQLWLNAMYYLNSLGIRIGYDINLEINNVIGLPEFDFENQNNKEGLMITCIAYERTENLSSKDILIMQNPHYLYGDFTMADPITSWETSAGYTVDLFDYVFDPGYFEMESYPTSYPANESYPYPPGDNSYPVIIITTENTIFIIRSSNYDDPQKLKEVIDNVVIPKITSNEEVKNLN